MLIKEYKLTTPGRRGMTSSSCEEITTDKPEKSLLESLKSKGGRNNNGRITTRRQGGGHKRAYRVIDFKRNKDGIPVCVAIIEHDPNRSANTVLLNYTDGGKCYIIAPKGLTVGMNIISGEGADIKAGSAVELKDIPEGTFIHNIELRSGKGGQSTRSADAPAQILNVEEKYTTVCLASGEICRILLNCRATIGQVGSEDHSLVNCGKVGRMKWKSTHPTARGSVVDPNDHSHGGGEGRISVGRKSPMTPWGRKAMGVKTRKAKKALTKLIVRRHNGK